MQKQLEEILIEYDFCFESAIYGFNGVPHYHLIHAITQERYGKVKVLRNTQQYKLTINNKDGFTLISKDLNDIIGVLEYLYPC